MFVMALDMLMMAGEKTPFVERLGGLLGPDSYIFPPESLTHLQPAVKVRDVHADLYEFRNVIAHGREIPKKPYREKYDLLDDKGARINYVDYDYAKLMRDSGLFLLTGALRKVSVDGLFDEVRDEGKWRDKLRCYEHRWKNYSTAPTPNKGR